jgi:tRNA threonylcarbamoyladenosine biosynthesis protein TsaE
MSFVFRASSFKFQTTTHSPEETQNLGKRIGSLLQSPMLITLTGELASGKTVFVQGLAKGLEVPYEYYITSPTFTLVNEYPGRFKLFHVDLYRLDYESDLEDIGLFETLESGGVVAIEWAEKLNKNLLSDHLAIHFAIAGDQIREIDIIAYGQQANDLIKALGRPTDIT